MIYATRINFEADNLGYVEDVEAVFSVTYDPAQFSDEQDCCEAELMWIDIGKLRLNRTQVGDMIGNEQLCGIEEMVAQRWLDNERHEVAA